MPNDQSEIKVDCSLNQDFIMVWDNIVPDAFCDWLVDYLEKNSSYIMGARSRNYLSDKQVAMHNFSPAELMDFRVLSISALGIMLKRIHTYWHSPSLAVVSCFKRQNQKKVIMHSTPKIQIGITRIGRLLGWYI